MDKNWIFIIVLIVTMLLLIIDAKVNIDAIQRCQKFNEWIANNSQHGINPYWHP